MQLQSVAGVVPDMFVSLLRQQLNAYEQKRSCERKIHTHTYTPIVLGEAAAAASSPQRQQVRELQTLQTHCDTAERWTLPAGAR